MAKKKFKKLTDEELMTLVKSRVDTGTAFLDSGLQMERRDVREYWLGNHPLPMTTGGSKYRSQDVYVGVETMKALIVENFSAGSNIVQFAPQTAMDVVLAQQATALTEFIIHRQNDAMRLFLDVSHDGLTNRVGFAKVYWDKCYKTEDYTFEDYTLADMVELMENPDVSIKELDAETIETDYGPLEMFSGSYEIATDASQVRMTAVPPEDIIVYGRCTKLEDAKQITHRERMTIGELISQYPEKESELMADDSLLDDDMILEQETLEREYMDNAGYGTNLGGVGGGVSVHGHALAVGSGGRLDDEDDSIDESGRIVSVYESYVKVDLEGTGRQSLWRVVHCGEVLIAKDKVDEHPFVTFIPAPVPHLFYGDNFASRIIPTANVKTTLIRSVIEHAVDSSNPRWMVARGGIQSPKELMDNRKGGIVNVRDLASSIAPMPQQQMNPFVMSTIGLIDEDKQDITGVSRLSQGLDKNALSNRNSGQLIEQLTDNSMIRSKIICRLFADQFLKDLYIKVYSTAIKNMTEEQIIEIAGDFVKVSPSEWNARKDVRVDLTLGYGAREEKVNDLLQIHTLLSSDPAAANIYGEEQRYKLYTDILKTKGYMNFNDFLADPAKLAEQAQEPDPAELLQLEMLQKEMEFKEREQALKEAKAQHEFTMDQAKSAREDMDMLFMHSLREREVERKEMEVANRIDISQAETMILMETSRNPNIDRRALTSIASPNA